MYITDNLVFLNARQAEHFLGENGEPGDVEYFDGFPARASWARHHEGLYIVLLSDEE